MIDQTQESGHPDFVFVDHVPQVYALHRSDEPTGDGLVAWVFALPGGTALVVDHDGEVIAYTSLERIGSHWIRRWDVRLVQVAEDPVTRRAA